MANCLYLGRKDANKCAQKMKATIKLIALVGLIATLSWACEKDNRLYRAKIVVTVNDTVRAQNALVHVFAPVEGSFIDYYIYTNNEGEAEVQFLNKVVVDVVATKSPFRGCRFIEVERGDQVAYLDMRLFNDENNGCRDNQ